MTTFHNGRLTSTDASFLYLERRSAPMHIGAVCLFDGRFDPESYRKTVAAKLTRLPRFRECLVNTPFFLSHATWEPADDFDITEHVLVHQLPKKDSAGAFRSLINELIATRLDRSKPLWELHVIDGLPDGTTAIVSKVHHAMVDGVGGNQILTTILDLSPKAKVDAESDLTTESVPAGAGTRIMEALWDNAHTTIDGVANAQRVATSWGTSGQRNLRHMFDGLRDELPNLLRPPRRLPFNRSCGHQRNLQWTRFSFAEARAIRAQLGGTVNDVVLTALAGAVRRYCEHHDVDVSGRHMRVMVPVNVRPEGASADLGNQVSVLPADLPLGIADPAARLASIRESTRSLKRSRLAEGIHMMTELAGTVPVPLQAAFGALATSPVPVFNTVCTNVPGPQIPLYAMGVPLREYYPHVPVGFNMGVGCAIFSYNQTLHVGLNSDTVACPDPERLCDALDAEFAALRDSAEVEPIDTITLAGVARWRSAEAEAKGRAASRRKAAAQTKTTQNKTTQKKTTKKAAKKKTAKRKTTRASGRRKAS